MQLKESYKTEANINDNSNQSFTLDGLNIPLARKLAVVGFMDSMSNLGQIQGIKIGNEIYDPGSIILNDNLQSHIGFHGLLSAKKSRIFNPINLKIGPEKSNYGGSLLRRWGVQPWRSFKILLLNTWKRLFPSIFAS